MPAPRPAPRSGGDLWLPYRRPRPASPRLRLFCFPYAGGGAALYRGFQEELPDDVEVLAVQLPGRETRIAEPLVPQMGALVTLLADGLADRLAPPFAFFGYSMGALVAFELARELGRRGLPLPVHLVVAACPAPHLPDDDGTHTLPDDALIERLRALGGMSEEILAHRELMEMVLPIFRADAAVTETYVHPPGPPLDVSITAVGGLDDDKATRADLAAWQAHTRRAFRLAVLPGGHFFLRTARAALLAEVARALGGAR